MNKKTSPLILLLTVASAAVLVAIGYTAADGDTPIIDTPPAASAETSTSTAETLSDLDAEEALRLLERTAIAEPAGVEYDRDAFGPSWADVDRNGCDTRNDILARDLDDVVADPETHDCVVLEGELEDPYTGELIAFERGEKTSSLVQIDHVIPLSWAEQQGASLWSDEQRVAFANDPLNLVAVDGSANASKGDRGPGEWLPENTGAHCGYAARFLEVVDRYELTVPPTDAMVLEDLLVGCSGEESGS